MTEACLAVSPDVPQAPNIATPLVSIREQKRIAQEEHKAKPGMSGIKDRTNN